MNITKEIIKSMIYEIRGKKVMLANDLAKLFNMETKNINKAAGRNIHLFDKNNYFQLTKNEYDKLFLRFQIGTLNRRENNRGSHIKYLPYVFTYEGIKSLSTILKSETVKVTTKFILEVFEEKDNELIIPNSLYLRKENIKNMIYEMNGLQVMLDEDLAML